MYVGKTLFAQVMEFVPWTSFARIVQRYGGNAGVRSCRAPEQFRAMQGGATLAALGLLLVTDFDRMVIGSIFSFWFVDRALRRGKL